MTVKKLLVFLSSIALATAAYAGDSDEVVKKCTAAMTSAGAANVEESCACFAGKLSDAQKAEYAALDLAQWTDKASAELKAAGAACFPE